MAKNEHWVFLLKDAQWPLALNTQVNKRLKHEAWCETNVKW